jgi:hypothetical protein
MRHRSLETTMLYLHTGGSDPARVAKAWRKRHPIRSYHRRERTVSMHAAVRQFTRDLTEL